MTTANCDNCKKEYEKRKSNQRFCSTKCKTQWHKAKPLGSGVPVQCKGTRYLKTHIEVKLRVEYSEQENLARVLVPGTNLILAKENKD